MNILISTHVFSPMTGGIETMTALLAEEFTKQGHSVRIVTQTPCDKPDTFAYQVFRQARRSQLLKLVQWSDVFFHSNICLQMAWPLLFVNRPWVIVHHTWIGTQGKSLTQQERMKRFVLRFASCISVSQAIADHVPAPSVIIGNAYDDEVFYEVPEVSRTNELVFLGRLVSDKGADVLIEALGLLKRQGIKPCLTLIGEGPERAKLKQLTHDLEIENQVNFPGQKTGTELTKTLNQHQILVVPSRWQEPFGIVALEGIACGCVVVGSQEGGLKDAIGPCGATFPNGNAEALATLLQDLLSNPERLLIYQKSAPLHLAHHRKESVANSYLRVLENAVEIPKPSRLKAFFLW